MHEWEWHPWRHRFPFREDIDYKFLIFFKLQPRRIRAIRRRDSGREKRPNFSSLQLNANPFSLFVSLLPSAI